MEQCGSSTMEQCGMQQAEVPSEDQGAYGQHYDSGSMSTSSMIGAPVQSAMSYINEPHEQIGPIRTFFDYVAELNIAARTNPRAAFFIGLVLGFVIIMLVGVLACAGGKMFKIKGLESLGKCGMKLFLGALIASVIIGAAFWFRASLLQGNRRKLVRMGLGQDDSFMTSILMPSLLTTKPL